MPHPLEPNIRELLLAQINLIDPKGQGEGLQQSSVLNAVVKKLGGDWNYTPHKQQAILTQWGELFRTGLLAWGLNISNPNPPFFHLTASGKRALSNLTRDPSNPAGYLRHLNSIATVDAIAMSYLTEALECHVVGLFKAAAVMVGGAAERVILDLRDTTIQRLTVLNRQVPNHLNDWKIKPVSDALFRFFDSQKSHFKQELKEPFEAYWSAFAQQIRATRNDAGHPVSVDPVTADTVHASLLIFPELVRLANGLSVWVAQDLK